MALVDTTCQVCSVLFKAPKRELKRGNAKYCSKPCVSIGISKSKAAAGRINKSPNVSCAGCNKEFYKNASQQKGSKSGLFFCSRACKDASQRIGGVTEIMPPHYGTGDGKHQYRELALTGLENSCNRCGYCKYSSVLEVHHKDRDRTNNKLENLEVLCPTCHREHHYEERTGLFSRLSI